MTDEQKLLMQTAMDAIESFVQSLDERSGIHMAVFVGEPDGDGNIRCHSMTVGDAETLAGIMSVAATESQPVRTMIQSLQISIDETPKPPLIGWNTHGTA